MATEEKVVRVSGVEFSRGSKVIFDGLDIEVARGTITAVMGPSGTGKTTLLKLIGGQERPRKGTIEVAGSEVAKLSRRQLFKLRKQIGMLFQSGALLTDIDVFDNVAYPLRAHFDLSETMIQRLVLMKLQAVGLRGAKHLLPAQLSGGMARRVALARALALEPELVLYDEPFTGQDPISLGILVRLIKQLNDALGLTSIIVSHDIHETLSIADYVYVIGQGKVIGQGTPQSLLESESPFVKQFVRGLPDGPLPFHYEALDYRTELLGHDSQSSEDGVKPS